jgi:hypothetical protein
MKLAIVIAAILATALMYYLEYRKRVAASDTNTAPSDAEVIEQLRLAGSDLSKPHDVEFFLYFATEKDAQDIAAQLVQAGYETIVRKGDGESQYLLKATRAMVPSESELVRIRYQFGSLAAASGGVYDGWGTPVVR